MNKKLIRTIVASAFIISSYSSAVLAADFYKRTYDAFYDNNFDQTIELATQSISAGNLPDDRLFHMYNMRGSSYSLKRLDAMEEGDKQKEQEYVEMALSDFDKAIALNSNEFSPYFSRGTLYKFTQQYEKAISDLEKALELWKASDAPKNNKKVAKASAHLQNVGSMDIWKQSGFTIQKQLQDARILLEAEATGPKLPSNIPKFDRGAPGAELVEKGWLVNWEGENEQAMDYFEEAANLGNADAMSFLASGYEIGHGRPQNTEKWMELKLKSIEHGRVNGYYEIGKAYQSKNGVVAQDFEEANRWFKKASEAGVRAGDLALAFAHIYGRGVEKDIEKGNKMLESLAKKGYAKAQWNLGMFYYDDIDPKNGDYYKQDYRKAVRWLRKSAKQGYVSGQTALSIMYQHGLGVLQDYKKAFRWLEQAALQGDSMAQYNIGVMYWNGKGVEQDRNKAKVWWKKSAQWGNKNAAKALQSVM